MSVSAISYALPQSRRRRYRPVAAVIAVAVALAMLALYAVRPVDTGSGPGEGFRGGYTTAVTEFQADLAALQDEGRRVTGASTAEILPIYEQLRQVTQVATERFAELTPPAGAEDAYATFTGLLAEQVEVLDSVLRNAKSGSARALGADLQRYAALVADWLTARPRLEAATR